MMLTEVSVLPFCDHAAVFTLQVSLVVVILFYSELSAYIPPSEIYETVDDLESESEVGLPE